MRLRAETISRKFPRKTGEANFFYAVNPTDLTLEPGTLTIVMGRSGSGKTTLLNMLAGLLAPSEGKVILEDSAVEGAGSDGDRKTTLEGEVLLEGAETDGAGTSKDLYALSDKDLSILRNEYIGVVPQGHTGLDSLTVLENVKLPYALYHKDDGADARARELLEKMDIAHLAEVYPSELSGGEVRRLAIARALVMEPAVLLADEPTGDLDDENTEVVLKLFRELADRGTAVLVVTHESESKRYADRVFRMDAGTLRPESGEKKD